MNEKLISVKIHSKKGSEESYFVERDQKLLRELREKGASEASKKYCEDHKYHCFRCGTKSLVEIDDHHQCHAGKVMPLGQHLCADQDAGLAASHGVDHAIHLHRCRARRLSTEPPTGRQVATAPAQGVYLYLEVLAWLAE